MSVKSLTCLLKLAFLSGYQTTFSMGHFPGDDRRGGGFKKRWDSERRGPATLHKATCSECGKECEVPFRPTGDRPIFCSDCFAKKRADGDLPPKREFHDRPSFKSHAHAHDPQHDGLSKQITELTTKIDRLVNAVERLARSGEDAKGGTKATPLIAMTEEKEEKPVKALAKKATKAKSAAPAKKVAAKKKK